MRTSAERQEGGQGRSNHGFSRWFAEWYDPEHNNTSNPPTTPPFGNLDPDFFEDYESNERLLTGSLNGVVLDPQLRTGGVSISTSGGFTLPAGKRVPFTFSVTSGVDLWIFYDDNLSDSNPAKWDHVTSGETFYAGNGRPMSFNLTYEGDDPGLDQTVTARAAVNAYCSGSNSWRVLRARDDVLLHVVETELTADSTNDDGLDKSASTWATIEDDYVEWVNQERSFPSPGKLLSVNDEDPGGPTVPDWADGFNADGVTGGTPGDDSSPQAAFTPIQVTLPGWNHGQVKFRFIYAAADPRFSNRADPSARVDPADMRRTGNVQDGNIRYDMGTGKMRLWTKDGSVQRNGFDVNNSGDFVDSQEWDVASSSQKPVYYTHSDFGLSSASGGTITLWVEALRPSVTLGDRAITLQAVYAEQYTSNGNTQTLLAHSYTESKLIPLTVVDVDLDIDSDNDNGFALPSRSDYEDMLEDGPDLPGKFIAVNDDDTDGDNLIDWADFNGIAGEQFVPLKLVLPAGVDLAGATIRFDYEASNPGGLDLLNLPNQPPTGTLRLWNKEGHEVRSPLVVGNVPSNNIEGNYVSPGVELPVVVLFESGVREITLWAEAVRPSTALGDQRIEMKLTLDVASNNWMNQATTRPDWVRLTAHTGILDRLVVSDANLAGHSAVASGSGAVEFFVMPTVNGELELDLSAVALPSDSPAVRQHVLWAVFRRDTPEPIATGNFRDGTSSVLTVPGNGDIDAQTYSVEAGLDANGDHWDKDNRIL